MVCISDRRAPEGSPKHAGDRRRQVGYVRSSLVPNRVRLPHLDISRFESYPHVSSHSNICKIV